MRFESLVFVSGISDWRSWGTLWALECVMPLCLLRRRVAPLSEAPLSVAPLSVAPLRVAPFRVAP